MLSGKDAKPLQKKAVDSDDSSSDTDVGSELAALSASFADAVTRVGKRASAKTMKGLRASATPVGYTANKSPADGLEWVSDPGIWIFLGSGICTGGVRLISLSPNQPFCEINRARQNYLQNSRN